MKTGNDDNICYSDSISSHYQSLSSNVSFLSFKVDHSLQDLVSGVKNCKEVGDLHGVKCKTITV